MGLRSRSHGAYILGLFAALNFLNYANRNVVFSMFADLRASFSLSNAELGLLGTVFMVSHAVVTVPLGWMADRLDRRRVIALGVAGWSLAGIASAAADTYWGLLSARALVGVGTATCVPVATALLCDVFPAERKAYVVSVFNVGLFVGGAAGFAFGGLLGFPGGVLAAAVPGLLLAALIAPLDVPPRRVAASPATSWPEAFADVAALVRIPTMRWTLLGAVLMAFGANGYVFWFADFVDRYKDMTVAHATAVFGTCALTGGLSGVLMGGRVGDRLARRRPYGRLAAISLGIGTAIPFALLSIFVDNRVIFYPSAWLFMFFVTWYHGPLAAVVDDLVDDERAATAQAGTIFAMHLIGTASAPSVIGVVSDAVGLRWALVVPTAAIGLAALAFIGGWPTMKADHDAARAHRRSPPR